MSVRSQGGGDRDSQVLRCRRGLTLLELVVAASMLAVVVTSLTLVLRTARSAWEIGDEDYSVVHHAENVARHFVRQCREAEGVESITANTISMNMPSDEVMQWELVDSSNGMDDVVLVTYLKTGDVVPLSREIEGLNFVGFKADATTQTTAIKDIQLVQVQVEVTMPTTGVARTITADAWLRSW